MHFELLLSAGMLPIITVGLPGAQGAVVIGVHTPGVSTPSAAAVWAAVIGLASDMHTPNGRMLTNGLLSMMVAAGLFSIITLFDGMTLSVDGAAPNEHDIAAVAVTGMPMRRERSASILGAPPDVVD